MFEPKETQFMRIKGTKNTEIIAHDFPNLDISHTVKLVYKSICNYKIFIFFSIKHN